MKVFVVFGLMAWAAASAAETNTLDGIPVQATALKLTKEMERLNGSKYFFSRVDEWKRVMVNGISRNLVGNELDDPAVYLNATRRQPENGPIEYKIDLSLYTEAGRKWVEMSRTQELYMVIDGARYTLGASEVETRTRGDGLDALFAVEHAEFKVPEQFMITLGQAKKAQLRIDGLRWSIGRDLDKTNLARFKIFKDVFIGKGQGTGSMAPKEK